MKFTWFAGFALVVLLAFGWAAAGPGGVLVTKEPRDFYGFLTDAFLSGQTYLKVAPNPALQNLANPWAGAQGIPRLHDASYFRGRYYLYFGPPPVLLILLPWRVLTGSFLAQNVATFIFAAAGTLVAGALLLWAWRRWFERLPHLWLVLGLLLMASASRAIVLVEDSSVYQVPTTCAFFCLMAAISGVAWAISAGERVAPRALGAASLAWGLAVSSRPDYIFSLGALVVPVAYLAWRGFPGQPASEGRIRRLAIPALAPAALIGAAMAAYNYVRFGEVAQFGMKYQFTAGDQRFLKFFAPASLPENLHRYFFSRPSYTWYFPFLNSGENWGLLFCTPFVILVALLPFALGARHRPEATGWGAWAVTLAAALVPNTLLLCTLAIANERYFLDFVPLAVLLSVVSAWAFLEALRRNRSSCYRVAQVAIGGLAFWTVGQGALMAMSSYADPGALRPVARAADRIVSVIESWKGVQHGPVLLRIRFPRIAGGTREPLLVSGHGRDVLYVEYPAPGQIRLGFFHAGAGGPLSDARRIETDRPHLLRIDLGSLYPPTDHPLLATWPEPLAEVLRHRLDVALDGQDILHGAAAFYPTDPGDVLLGTNVRGLYAPGRFTGQIEAVTREGVPSPASLRGPPGEGPVRLVVHFPTFENFRHEPLISTGHRGAGDLLYVAYVSPGVVRLGLDSWGSGALETAPLAFDPTQDQIIDADLGSLRSFTGPRQVGNLALRFNGQLAMLTQRPFNASPPAEIVFGFNGCDSSTAAATFSGKIVRTTRIGPIENPPPVAGQFGPVQLVLRFPEDHATFSQPLVATGQPKAGDLIFVHYLDDHRLAFGYAHAGAVALMTRPLAVDYGATHAVTISLGSLYPKDSGRAWMGISEQRQAQARTTISVTLDGEPALLAAGMSHPAGSREISVGDNRIGAPDCESTFTGTLFLKQRLAVAELASPRGEALVPDIQDGSGPIRLALRFPSDRPGRNEPLVVTGRTGAGDVIYVHYVDARHISLGYDHWNAGGPLSPPIPVDYATPHLIEVSLGSLYQKLTDPAWAGTPDFRRRQLLATVAVQLDGQPVLNLKQTAYVATPGEIQAGLNQIGASTCDPVFTGEMISEQRVVP
jgi:hypothetical protein